MKGWHTVRMIRHASCGIGRLVTAVLTLLLAGCAAAPPRAAGAGPLILISIDGFRADYFDRGRTPTLTRLARDGVRAQAMRPAFPSLTFPNHYTLVTGLVPDHHGIVHNRMDDPISGAHYIYNDPKTTSDPTWWGGEPLWVGAERQGVRTATMFWPGSDVAISGVRPSRWLRYDGRVTATQRVDKVLEWLDQPASRRPRFVTLYFDQVDHAGHDGGPDSAAVDAAIAKIDIALRRLLDGLAARGLRETTNLVIVSDHGQAPAGIDKLIFLDDLMDPNVAGATVYGVIAGFRPKPEHEARVAATLLAPHEHMQCWRKQDVPSRFHYGTNARIPPLLCLADVGWMITTHAYLAQRKKPLSKGDHGYDIDAPEMRALFVAHGPAFRRGLVVPEFDNVNVYPLLARVLGIAPAPNDGDAAVTAPMLGDLAAP